MPVLVDDKARVLGGNILVMVVLVGVKGVAVTVVMTVKCKLLTADCKIVDRF
jgi:hypothetical protein